MTSNRPRLFRLNVEVGDIDRAAAFYAQLLGLEARPQMGSRVYIDAGGVKALYFSVDDLDALHARAAALDCLSQEQVHGMPAGAAIVRPWGERSFYAEDPWGNPLCFVEEGTVYAG